MKPTKQWKDAHINLRRLYEAAAKFARGLRCNIEDISQEMADSLKADILPFVRGKAWRRAAVLVAFLLAPNLLPHDAQATALKSSVCVLCKMLRRWLQSRFPYGLTLLSAKLATSG